MIADSIGIVGLGYIGLPLALSFEQAGYDVIGVDIDIERIRSIREGKSFIDDISGSTIMSSIAGDLKVTTEYNALSAVDAVSICVPTPLRKTGRPDLSHVIESMERLVKIIPRQCVIIVESTVYPGATEELIAQTLTDNGYKIGEEMYVAFSPERIDPGNQEYDLHEIPKIIGGVTPECGERACDIYSQAFEEVIIVESSTEAEMVKLLENTFRAVNIGLINELATIGHELDVDIWNAIEAASTKPFGFMTFYPGPGLGGHCIPIDPLYLSWKAKESGTDAEFIELADRINREMPQHVVRRIVNLLNERALPVSRSEVLILGVSYKSDVSDTRESPAYDVITDLQDMGATINYHDPYVPKLNTTKDTFESCPLTVETIREADCTVIITNHSTFDIEYVCKHAELVFDTRNATEGLDLEHVHKI